MKSNVDPKEVMGTVRYEAQPGSTDRAAIAQAIGIRDALPEPWITLVFNGEEVEINSSDSVSTVSERLWEAANQRRRSERSGLTRLEADQTRIISRLANFLMAVNNALDEYQDDYRD